MMRDEELQSRIESWIDGHKEQMIQDAIELVKIKSVSQKNEGGFPYGSGCAKVLDAALKMAKRMGFETENQDYYSGTAYLRGKTEKQLGVFGHLDIVPEGDLANWEFDPYDAVFKDGYILGRGSSDNKCPAVASLYALQCIKDLEIPMNHTVMMYFGCDEEAGMTDIVHFWTNHEAPEFSFTSDGRYSLCHGEKGILTAALTTDLSGSNLIGIWGGQASNMVPDYAKAILKGVDAEKLSEKFPELKVTEKEDGTVVAEAAGIAAHAAFPEGSESALRKLASILAAANILDEKGQRAAAFMSEGFQDYYGTGLHIDFEDEIVGKTTAVGGMAFVENGKLTQLLNVRYALKADQEEMIENLKRTCGEYGFEVENLKNDPPMYMDLENPCVKILHETANEFLDGTYTPYVMGGGTYARKIPNAVAYGPTTRKIDATDPLVYGEGHQPNEGMKLTDMTVGIRIYVNALLRLDELLKSNIPQQTDGGRNVNDEQL